MPAINLVITVVKNVWDFFPLEYLLSERRAQCWAAAEGPGPLGVKTPWEVRRYL